MAACRQAEKADEFKSVVSRVVRMRSIIRSKSLKSLERVKGIEPSYSAWKAGKPNEIWLARSVPVTPHLARIDRKDERQMIVFGQLVDPAAATYLLNPRD